MSKFGLSENAAIVAAVVAAAVCYQLLNKHIHQTPGPAWFEAGCSDRSEPGAANCAAVLQSPWSYYPPKMPNESPERGHVPVAFLGLLYYALLIVWFVGVGQPTRSRRWIHLLPLLVIGLGLTGSVFFLYVMFSKLQQWCPWCVVTHACNGVIAVAAVLMWPRRGSLDAAAEGQERAAAWHGAHPHPSGRALITTLIACGLAIFGASRMLGHANERRMRETYEKIVKNYIDIYQRLAGDGRIFVLNWQQAARTPLTLRADDPRRTSAESLEDTLGIVVFSDFECPQCRKFARKLDEQVQPLFGGNLLVWFKHYPLDMTCNAQTTETKHPHACEAARMAEAGRSLSGNAGFWTVHDRLFEEQDALKAGTLTPESVAERLGIDGPTFRATMDSAAVAKRIQEDGELARQAGLTGTPAVYINDRRLDPLALDNLRFWDQMADIFWKAKGTDRPESTKLTPAPATPNTPGPSAGP